RRAAQLAAHPFAGGLPTREAARQPKGGQVLLSNIRLPAHGPIRTISPLLRRCPRENERVRWSRRRRSAVVNGGLQDLTLFRFGGRFQLVVAEVQAAGQLAPSTRPARSTAR